VVDELEEMLGALDGEIEVDGVESLASAGSLLRCRGRSGEGGQTVGKAGSKLLRGETLEGGRDPAESRELRIFRRRLPWPAAEDRRQRAVESLGKRLPTHVSHPFGRAGCEAREAAAV